jgi:uncharacterized membrane protein HdeD (DUF308 family)
MNAKMVIGIVLLVVGLILLYLGYQSSQGFDDQVSEAITGEYTESTVWYWVLGAAAAIGGIALMVMPK